MLLFQFRPFLPARASNSMGVIRCSPNWMHLLPPPGQYSRRSNTPFSCPQVMPTPDWLATNLSFICNYNRGHSVARSLELYCIVFQSAAHLSSEAFSLQPTCQCHDQKRWRVTVEVKNISENTLGHGSCPTVRDGGDWTDRAVSCSPLPHMFSGVLAPFVVFNFRGDMREHHYHNHMITTHHIMLYINYFL